MYRHRVYSFESEQSTVCSIRQYIAFSVQPALLFKSKRVITYAMHSHHFSFPSSQSMLVSRKFDTFDRTIPIISSCVRLFFVFDAIICHTWLHRMLLALPLCLECILPYMGMGMCAFVLHVYINIYIYVRADVYDGKCVVLMPGVS